MIREDVVEFEAGEAAVFLELTSFCDSLGGVADGDCVEWDGHG